MARTMIRVGTVLLVLLAVLVLLVLAGRHLPPSAQQAQAMAALDEGRPASGVNAWGTIRLLPYAVPADRRDALVAEDAARLAAWVPDQTEFVEARAGIRVASPPPSPPGPVNGGFERYDRPTGPLPGCREPDDCLRRIQAEPDHLRQQLGDTEALLDRFDQLAEADHLHAPFEPRIHVAFVLGDGHQLHRPALVARALQFLDEPLPALAGVCRMHAASRRLATRSDMLVDAMMLGGQAQASGQLLAEMLVELPPGQVLPGDCDLAFTAPGPDAAVLCDAMAGEFRLSRGETERTMAQSRWVGLLHSDTLAARWLAESMGWACTPAGRQRLAEDRPVTSEDLPEPSSRRLQCLSAPATCLMLGAVAPAYLDYHNRALDLAAEQRLLAIAAALRQSGADGGTAESAVDALVGRWPGRPVRLADDGRWLEIDRFGRGPQPVARIPVAAPATTDD